MLISREIVNNFYHKISSEIETIASEDIYGRVTKLLGMVVEIEGASNFLTIGGYCLLKPDTRPPVLCEIIGFDDNKALAMPFGDLMGIGPGCPAYLVQSTPSVFPSEAWLGRVVNALGEPLDDEGVLNKGTAACSLKQSPPKAHKRQRVGERLDLGVRTMNTFLSTCRGQRMGIFAGSGVGKSVLLSMMARYTKADITIIGLIGERGREVQEFLQDDLGPEGLKRSVVVVATSDEPPLMKRQAAYLTLALAEFFRDQGKEVLCLMDSVTRFAMAHREIGLSVGEPPTSKGYPPSTFPELAHLLERAGPGVEGSGNITGIFTVLVEGDDHNEPISDTVRGILDGHIVMDRKIADRGRFPAIDVLKSVSRTMPGCLSDDEYELIKTSKRAISTYEDMEELIRLGAYRKGSDPQVDEAIELYPKLEAFLGQNKADQTIIGESYTMLRDILAKPQNETVTGNNVDHGET
jgi:flagellum-specific ATP synthase